MKPLRIPPLLLVLLHLSSFSSGYYHTYSADLIHRDFSPLSPFHNPRITQQDLLQNAAFRSVSRSKRLLQRQYRLHNHNHNHHDENNDSNNNTVIPVMSQELLGLEMGFSHWLHNWAPKLVTNSLTVWCLSFPTPLVNSNWVYKLISPDQMGLCPLLM